MKPTWNEYFFGIMDAVSKRATCDRGRSGCVIVKDNRILATGYVGSPAGFPECDEVGHEFEYRIHNKDILLEYDDPGREIITSKLFSMHCIRTIHAEMNAILHAAKFGIALERAELYCRMTPCRRCAEAIISVGISSVYCERRYQKAMESEYMFKKGGILFEYKFDEEQKYV